MPSYLDVSLLDALLKGAVVLALGHLAGALLRRWKAPATLRRATWALVFAVLLALPLGQAVLPQISVVDAVGEVERLAEAPANEAEEVRAPSSQQGEAQFPPETTPEAPAKDQSSAPSGVSGEASPPAASSPSALDEGQAPEPFWMQGWTWGLVLLGIWGVGVALLLARLLVGHLRSWRLYRRASPAEDEGWNEVLRAARAQIGTERTAEIRFHREVTPMSLGVFAPTILLPGSARTWPPERRRLILLHEMAHLKRRDLLLGLVGHLGRALHWPNPLVWTGWSRLLRAREAACDETVLAAGEDPETYAYELLAAARRVATGSVPVPALRVAQPTGLKERILAIVRREGPAAWPLGRKAFLGTLGLALIVLVMAARPLPNDWYPRVEQAEGVPALFLNAGAAGESPEPSPKTQNLRAFAKLYGYVRYFHPSDAAAETDWDAFVVHGARQVAEAKGQADLRATLDSLFSPIAPTVQLYEAEEQQPPPHDLLTPSDTTDLNLVAWQHKGLGLGNRGPYESARLHRETASSSRQSFGTVIQSVDAIPHRGKQVRLRAAVRADVSGAGNRAQLWLRVDRASGERGFFDNMSDRPVTDSTWGRYQITGSVAEDATRIVLGGFLRGSGTAHFDAFQLQVRDSSGGTWTDVPLGNAGLETGPPGESPAKWRGRPDGYTFRTREGGAVEGEHFLSITPDETPTAAPNLFKAGPGPGETVTKPLGRDLSVRIPLALYSEDEQTLRPDGAPSPDDLRDALDNISPDELTAQDDALRQADVIITWNVLQHFYPYFDVVDADWDQALTQSLQRAEADTSRRDLLRTLRRMLVPLEDGHGRVLHPETEPRTGLPLQFDRIGEEVVVADTVSFGGAQQCARPGDVLTSIGGTPVAEALRSAKRQISGSSQWRTVRALRELGEGPPGTTARLTLRRGNQTVECEIARADTSVHRRWQRQLQSEPRPDSIDVLSGGTHYVDLTRISVEGFRARLNTLAQAEAVVFDMRGYPEGGNQELLQYLSPDTLRSAHFEVPKLIYPDHQEVAGYTGRRWRLPPKTPQFSGEVAFLTDARAISHAESVMGIVEHYDLGTIVGQPTAGTIGNVNPLELPGQYTVYWTGMRVQKHDRSRHHLVGIRPDVRAERTIEGLRNGRDEVLEKALEVIRSGPPGASAGRAGTE